MAARDRRGLGLSKTESGAGRVLPLNDRAVAIFGFWASLFPGRQPSHFVFPAEPYGASGDGLTVVYDSDPTRPIGRWKEAWDRQKLGQAFLVDSTTCDTPAALGCLERGAILRRGNDHWMESINNGANVETLWPHWTDRSATSSQRAKPRRNQGRWGTKVGTVSNAACSTTCYLIEKVGSPG